MLIGGSLAWLLVRTDLPFRRAAAAGGAGLVVSEMGACAEDVLGLLSVIEADPGPHTTAYGLLADFLNAVVK